MQKLLLLLFLLGIGLIFYCVYSVGVVNTASTIVVGASIWGLEYLLFEREEKSKPVIRPLSERELRELVEKHPDLVTGIVVNRSVPASKEE